jgi:hypothetical protein
MSIPPFTQYRPKDDGMNHLLNHGDEVPNDVDDSKSRKRPLTIDPKENLDQAGRRRRRSLAFVLPITALLYMGAESLNPKGTDQIISTTAIGLKLLPIAARHSGQLYLSGSIAEVALAALAISYFAIATLIRHRSSTLATVAAVIGAVGAFCGIVTNVLIGINLATASTAHLTNIQAARFLTTSINSGVGQSFLDVYAFSEYLAPILMLVALWRSRMVPRWLAVVFFFGIALAEQTASVGPVRVVALMALFAVAMVLLAVRVWKSADSNDGVK